MPENKWVGFKSSKYKIVNLGRQQTFLVPVNKLDVVLPSGKTARDELHEFLYSNFRGFNMISSPIYGMWRDKNQKCIVDFCYRYEVSFVGKHRIPLVLRKLSELGLSVDEDCFYVTAGQYSALVVPKTRTKKKKRKPSQ